MSGFLFFIIVAVIVYLWFIRRGRAIAPMMGELAKRGTDIDAQVVKKYQVLGDKSRMTKYYLVYSFTLEDQQSFSKKISPVFEQWASLEEGDMLPVVYLDEDPNVSTTKDMAEQIRAAMP